VKFLALYSPDAIQQKPVAVPPQLTGEFCFGTVNKHGDAGWFRRAGACSAQKSNSINRR
jgi:hypothetical protein